MWRKTCFVILLLCLTLLIVPAAFAQDTVTVPDVKGLNVPQAAAALNKNGLLLGKESDEGWTEASGLPQNAVSAQSVAAGQQAARGTAIDITVLHAPNVVLIYDDNNFTLLNHTGTTISLQGMSFASADGKSAAAFDATTWGGTLKDGDCGQVWSVRARTAKVMKECDHTQWVSTTNTAKHFWTGTNGATQFTVVQGGVVRATCPVSTSGNCQFYLPAGGSAGDVTAYVYFVYTPDRLMILNQSADKWMPLAQLKIYNQNFQNGKTPLTIGDPSLFTAYPIMGDATRLAPGQCMYFNNKSPNPDSPPLPCETIVARLDITPGLIFWSKDFSMDSVTDGQRHTCPAAVADHMTICVMPR